MPRDPIRYLSSAQVADTAWQPIGRRIELGLETFRDERLVEAWSQLIDSEKL